MRTTIWHDRRCSKSRAVLHALEAQGFAIEVIDYLRQPPDAATLRRLFARAGMTPRQGLRRDAAAAASLVQADDDAVLAFMAANPATLERPFVETDKGVRLCRPVERLADIL